MPDVLDGDRLRSRSLSKVIDHILQEDGALDDITICHLSQRHER